MLGNARLRCLIGLAAGAGEEGCDDVGRVAVQPASTSVLAHGGPRVGVEAAPWRSRSGTPASSAAVMNECRRLCGLIRFVIPARRAIRLTVRSAAYRSIRAPPAPRKMGPPARSSRYRLIALEVRSDGDGDVLAALAHDLEREMAALVVQVLDVGPGGLGDPQHLEGQERDQGMIAAVPTPAWTNKAPSSLPS